MKRRHSKWMASVGAALGLIVAMPLPWAVAATGEDRPHVQQALDAMINQGAGAPGAMVVAGNENGSWYLSSGTGKILANAPIGPGDHVQIGSITKTFVSVVILQLVAEGKVELDTPIERYLPGVVRGNGYDGSRISVRQILQHTSGIAEYVNPIGLYNPLLHMRTYTSEDLVKQALAQPPRFEPGTDYAYSNSNYALAGLLIERLTGHSYGEEITNRIIRPLGLDHTVVPKAGEKAMPDPHARGYIGYKAAWIDVTKSLHEPSYLGAAGNITSTGDDMLTFVRALSDGELLPPVQQAEMRKTVPMRSESDQAPDGYGLGLNHLSLSCGGEAWGHYGATAGYGGVAMATDSGDHAFVVTNSPLPARGTRMTKVVDSALCSMK